VNTFRKNRIKKLIALVISFALLLGISSFPSLANVFAATESLDNGNKAIKGQLIVSVEKKETMSTQSVGKSTNSIESTITPSGFTVKDSMLESTGIENNDIKIYSEEKEAFKNEVIKNVGDVYLVEYSDSKLSFEKAEKQLRKMLKKDGYKVKSIEKNYVMKAFDIDGTSAVSLDNDVSIAAVHASQKWQYDMIKAPQAWQITTGSRQVKVAILDTGIDRTHQCLSNFVDTNLSKNFTSGSTTDTTDRQGHGTHVAGTIASYGSVSGVMQEASLVSIKVLGDNGSGSTYGIEQGILYAASIDADVVNMSLGGGNYSSTFNAACQTAVSKGVIIVAASGNESASSISYPAAYSSVIAVGAVNSSKQRASFSNYGTGLAVMAPGYNIYSTSPGGAFKTMSGTSMASPHVAGVMGLMRSFDRNISVADATRILKSTAQPTSNPTQYGSGIVDVYAALQAMSGTTPVQTVATPSFSVASGTYTSSQNVAITTSTIGATIRYTTDGTEPTSSSFAYSGAIAISSTTTLKAKAFKASMNDSATATATYTISAGTGPVTGNAWAPYVPYASGDIVSFGGKNYKCVQPHTSLPGWEPSNVASLWASYGGAVDPVDPVDPVQTVAKPSFSVVGGTYPTTQNVAITTATAGATIRYTTNGTEPTSSSTVYSGAIVISKTTTLKAKAFKSGMNDSATVTATYTIDAGGPVTGNAWATYVPYTRGAVVSYNGKNYECIQPHTSLPGWDPVNVPSLWSLRA